MHMTYIKPGYPTLDEMLRAIDERAQKPSDKEKAVESELPDTSGITTILKLTDSIFQEIMESRPRHLEEGDDSHFENLHQYCTALLYKVQVLDARLSMLEGLTQRAGTYMNAVLSQGVLDIEDMKGEEPI